jgi:uncharacterized membrane protein YdjX (TVP38/TMEM64 family)
MHTGVPTASVVGFMLIFAISFVPVLPIPVVAGVLGAVCPLWIAFLVSWSAAVCASVLKYFILKYLLRNRAQAYLAKFPKAEPFLRFMEENGFLAVLTARMIPLIPSSVINVGASVTKVSDTAFIAATILGKMPVIFTFVLAGSSLKHSPWKSAVIVCIYAFIMLIVWTRLRKKRTFT